MANSKLILVNILNTTLLKKAEHVSYHTNIMTVIEGADAESIGLKALVYDPYCAAIETEQEVVSKINILTEEARQRLTYRLKANKAFIDKRIINGDEELSLPLPLEEVASITLEGNKLTTDNVKVTVLEKGQSGASKHKTYTVAEFVDRFDGVVETAKDENTGVETMVISAFTLGSYVAVTIESVEINA